MSLVFSVVAEIALVASENTLDITDPYSQLLDHMRLRNVIKNTMYNIRLTISHSTTLLQI